MKYNQAVLWNESIESGQQTANYHYSPEVSQYWGPAIVKLWAENVLGEKSKVVEVDINLPLPSAGRFRFDWMSGDEVKLLWDDIDPSWMSAEQKEGLKYYVQVGSWNQSVDQGTGYLVYPLNAALTYLDPTAIAYLWVEDPSKDAKSLEQTTTFDIPEHLVSHNGNNYIVPLLVVGGGAITIGAGVVLRSWLKKRRIETELWDDYYEAVRLKEMAIIQRDNHHILDPDNETDELNNDILFDNYNQANTRLRSIKIKCKIKVD